MRNHNLVFSLTVAVLILGYFCLHNAGFLGQQASPAAPAATHPESPAVTHTEPPPDVAAAPMAPTNVPPGISVADHAVEGTWVPIYSGTVAMKAGRTWTDGPFSARQLRLHINPASPVSYAVFPSALIEEVTRYQGRLSQFPNMPCFGNAMHRLDRICDLSQQSGLVYVAVRNGPLYDNAVAIAFEGWH